MRYKVPEKAAAQIKQAQDAEQRAREAWQNFAQGVGMGMDVPDGYGLQWDGDTLYWVPPPEQEQESAVTNGAVHDEDLQHLFDSTPSDIVSDA